ncbi:methionine--tRNA ligase, chloroplastic/mitochondrial-like [Carya illinoinensis]|uniref:methionine--tRNA ligase, chloroplastic/mitochondrial-like n=1 Tax=Carya illinoinensis TaxID=32201 RepID=UPI001C7230CB|nr:methionine--tRNA ligase, chloroplastic/mitochondrial-like [Carya illinoinensis]
MGKSLGNTLKPNDPVRRLGLNAAKYFFLREMEFGNDGDYSEDCFINIANAHLANTVGNFGLLKKNCQSTLVVDSTIAVEENVFWDTVKKLVRFVWNHVSYKRAVSLVE